MRCGVEWPLEMAVIRWWKVFWAWNIREWLMTLFKMDLNRLCKLGLIRQLWRVKNIKILSLSKLTNSFFIFLKAITHSLKRLFTLQNSFGHFTIKEKYENCFLWLFMRKFICEKIFITQQDVLSCPQKKKFSYKYFYLKNNHFSYFSQWPPHSYITLCYNESDNGI